MTTYFKNFTKCEVPESELRPQAQERLQDQNPDTLSFDALSPRRFEILCYRLKKTQYPTSEIELTQGAGDSGKDVVVYADGRIVEVTQCKNQLGRLTKPQLIEELCKLALCYCREPELLQTPTRYEIWCPAGLSKPASEVITTWPKRWTEADIGPRIKVLLRLPGFSDIDWSSARQQILHDFPRVLVPTKMDNVDLGPIVRRQRQIYDDFFVVHRSANLEDIRRVMSESGWRQMIAADLQHITDRVSSFDESERLYFGQAYVLGLKSDIVAQMTPQELEAFFKAVLPSTTVISSIVLKVGLRRASSLILERASTLREPDPILLPAANQMVALWVSARFMDISVPKALGLNKHWNDYRQLPFKEQAELVADLIWHESSAACAKSAINGDGPSDRNQRIALGIVTRFKTAEACKKRIVECLLPNRDSIIAITENLDRWLPTQLMVVADSSTWMDGTPTLVKHLSSTLDAITPASAPHLSRR